MPEKYAADFYVCGLPAGVTAAFIPNPVTAAYDASSSTRASAQTLLGLTVPYGTPPGPYALSVYASYQSPAGSPVTAPGGAYVSPSSLLLTIGASGNPDLGLPQAPLGPVTSNCSPIDASFNPSPTPTVGPSDVALSAVMSSQSPALNQAITVTGKLTVRGQPQFGQLMTAHWYFPFSVGTCTGVTDITGQASCSFTNAHTLPGFLVLVQISFVVNGQTYYATTSYRM
jgi:hypothetical protein